MPYVAKVTSPPVYSNGDKLHFKLVGNLEVDARASPEFVSNWAAFQGALLAIVLEQNGFSRVIGTAIIVAPGLAITASHVFQNELPHLLKSERRLFAFGIRSGCVQLWAIRTTAFLDGLDIGLFSIEPASTPPDDQTFFQLSITTRCPSEGEIVSLFGFRNQELETCDLTNIGGALATSKGPVTKIFLSGRDSVLLPFPSFQIDAGSLGGMSGGVVLDKYGKVIGVISTGLDSEQNDGPTFAALTFNCLNIGTEVPWPGCLHGKKKLTILDIAPPLVAIEGREFIQKDHLGKYHYKIWTETRPQRPNRSSQNA